MMRMHRRWLIVPGVIAGVLALVAGVVFAFSDSQTSAGAVNATSASVDLYICEASTSVPGPPCASDDSGPDETIFEGAENLLPGQQVQRDIRLINQGTYPWDILSFTGQVNVANDPGSDCSPLLTGDSYYGFASIGEKTGIPSNVSSMVVNGPTGKLFMASAFALYRINGATRAFEAATSMPGYAVDLAFNPSNNHIYAPHRDTAGGSQMSILDGISGGVLQTISMGNRPVAAAVNPDTNRIYVSNDTAKTLSIMDGLTDTVVGTIPRDLPPFSSPLINAVPPPVAA